MKIIVNALDLNLYHTRSVGIYNVAKGLCYGFANLAQVKLVIVCDGDFKKDLETREGVEWAGIEFLVLPSAATGFRRVSWETYQISKWADAQEADWLILPKGFSPFIAPKKVKLCSFVQDDMLTHYKENYPDQLNFFQKHYFPRLFKNSLRISDLVLTSSYFIKDEISKLGRSKAVEVAGIGFDEVARKDWGEGFEWEVLVYLSSAPHKCSAMVLEYLEELEQRWGREIKVCGVGGGSFPVFDRKPHWKRSARLDDVEYLALDRSAKVSVYASTYEGYGMPPRERIQKGLLMIASDLAPIREFCSPDLLFEHESIDDFELKLGKALALEEFPSDYSREFSSWGEVVSKLYNRLAEGL